MDRRAELERELRDRPGDYDLWQVYADHLAQLGEELWANWVLLNLAGERGGRDEAERQELRMAIGDRDVYEPELRPLIAEGYLRIVTLVHGFIGHAELMLRRPSQTADLAMVLAHPAARFLQRLDHELIDDVGRDHTVVQEVLDELAAHGLESLRELEIVVIDGTSQGFKIALAKLDPRDVFVAAPRLPRIRVSLRYGATLIFERDGRSRRVVDDD